MLKREVLIFIVIFVFLSLGMHMNQWLTHPLAQLQQLSLHAMPYHPLLYTAIVYLILALIRTVISTIMKLFRRK